VGEMVIFTVAKTRNEREMDVIVLKMRLIFMIITRFNDINNDISEPDYYNTERRRLQTVFALT
jgi:hypothetical protein